MFWKSLFVVSSNTWNFLSFLLFTCLISSPFREENVSDVCQPKVAIKKQFPSLLYLLWTGTFSCLKAKFRMVRNIGNFLISRYIPSFLIVCLSFTGFWIPTSAYPARVGLCITSLLALITQQYQNTLNVSYIYALNVWMMMCIFFVFACLIQYSFAISDWSELPFHYKKGKYNLNSGQITEMSVVIGNGRIASPTQPQNNHRNNKTSPHDVDNSQEKKNKKWTNRIISWNLLKPNSRNNRVDMISRLVFPSLYILGTFIYFVVYLI